MMLSSNKSRNECDFPQPGHSWNGPCVTVAPLAPLTDLKLHLSSVTVGAGTMPSFSQNAARMFLSARDTMLMDCPGIEIPHRHSR
jgi:hypothetical protein